MLRRFSVVETVRVDLSLPIYHNIIRLQIKKVNSHQNLVYILSVI